ncbi:MAG: response regulator [Lachnospiraceae bacterium]|nr:response regulator [Lachnospiraceae bacterium]
MRKLSKLANICFVILLAASALYYFWGQFIIQNPGYLKSWGGKYEGTFYWVNDEGVEEEFTLPHEVPADEEAKAVSIYTFLPDYLPEDACIFVYMRNNMQLYLDDELVLDFRDGSKVGTLAKAILIPVNLDSEDAGKKFTIVKQKTYSSNSNRNFYQMYLGDRIGVIEELVREEGFQVMSGIFLALLTMVVMFVCHVWGEINKIRLPLFYGSLGICLCAMWIISDSSLYQFVFQNYYIDGIIGYILSLLAPIPFIIYMDMEQEYRHRTLYSALKVLFVGKAIVFTALHFFTRNYNFTRTLYVKNVMLMFGIAIMVAILVGELIRGYIKEYRFLSYGLFGFFALSITELVSINIAMMEVDGLFVMAGLYWLLFMAIIQTIKGVVELNKEHERIREENRLKSGFLANISHEIRTPLSNIIGMNEMIYKKTNDPRIQEYSRGIRTSGHLLLGLLTDILDFTKIEAGKTEILEREYQLMGLLNDIYTSFVERAKEKGLESELIVNPNLPEMIFGDDGKIRQILVNLISNALKYTVNGKITLSFDMEETDKENFNLILSVKDTGRGIKEENLEKLFESFERLDLEKNRNIEGTGLGLSIVKNLVTTMNGKIEVSSVYGEGSEFKVTFPQKRESETRIGDAWREVAEGRYIDETETENNRFIAPEARILCVDDTPTNLFIIKEFLGEYGIKAETADSGQAGIEMTRENKYDLILMDHMMPEPDGVKCLHIIKDDAEFESNETPIVVLTANAIAGNGLKYMAEGFDGYLTKPVNLNDLGNVLRQYLPENYIIRRDDETPTGEENKEFRSALEKETSINTKVLYDRFRFAEEGIKNVLVATVEESTEKAVRMREALKNDNLKAYALDAHAIKGVMATIGESGLSERAKKMEFAAKEGNLDYVKEESETFIQTYLGEMDKIGKVLKAFDFLSESSIIEECGEKPEISNNDLIEKLDLIMQALADFDSDTAVEIAGELLNYKLEEETRAQIIGIKKKSSDFLYDEALKEAHTVREKCFEAHINS